MSDFVKALFARITCDPRLSSGQLVRGGRRTFRPMLEPLEDRRTPTASITGHVNIDPTGSGTFANLSAQSGVPVALFADTNSNGVLDGADQRAAAAQVSAADGSYSFTNLAPGTFFVAEIVPQGFVRLAPSTQSYFTVNVADGQNIDAPSFANFQRRNTSVVTNVSYAVFDPTTNTTTTVTNLRGHTHQGETVTVNFTIAPGASPTVVSFAAYNAPGASFDASTASQQALVQDATGTFGPGTHSLSVAVPNNFYQIDFVVGDAITHFGPAGSNVFYSAEHRLVSADNGGIQAVALASLSGTVYSDNGQSVPASGATVTLTYTNAQGQPVVVSTTKTDSNGVFHFTGLMPGTYTITVPNSGVDSFTATPGSLSGAPGIPGSGTITVDVAAGANGTGYIFSTTNPAS